MLGSRMLRLRPLATASVAATAFYAASSAFNERAKPKVHLRYFDVAGVAETIRHIMVLGDAPFTETAWPIDFSKFTGPDSVAIASPAFGTAREAGELVQNLGRAPVVVIDDWHTIGSSKTIERYLARKLGLMGDNEEEAAEIDAITEHVRDLKDKYKAAKAAQGKDKEAVNQFFATTMPVFMQKIDTAVGPSKRAPLVGSSLSLADLTLYVMLHDFFDNKQGALASISQCPRLLASVKAVGEEPKIAEYRKGKGN